MGMTSDLSNVTQMASETRERALQYAMSIETAEKNTTGRADELWLNAGNLAMDARDAGLMTLNSALIETCPKYRAEHERSGHVDLDEDTPGGTLHDHDCPNCTGIQDMARLLRTTLAQLWKSGSLEITDNPEKFRKVKNLHGLLLGQIHIAAAMADEHMRAFQGEE